MNPIELLRDFNQLFERAQRVAVHYLPPDSGTSEHEALDEIIGILDGPEQRRIQGQVRELLGNQPALFRAD